MSGHESLKAIIEFEGKKAIFEGSAQEVWGSINRFISEMQPKIAILSDIVLKVDFSELLTKFKDIIQIDKDVGPVTCADVNTNLLNETERILFTLLIRRITYVLGYSDKETFDVKEVSKESGAKSAGSLLSQLVAQKLVQNIADAGKKGTYRITDYGIQWFVQKVLDKLRSETK